MTLTRDGPVHLTHSETEAQLLRTVHAPRRANITGRSFQLGAAILS
jgi:hypothetical protein